jgi:hypothetical protein
MADSIRRIARTVPDHADRIQLVSHAAALDSEAAALDLATARRISHVRDRMQTAEW